MSFLTGLQLLFIGLKLAGYITWSWWFVILPLLLPLGIWAFLLIVALLIGGNCYIKINGKKHYF